MESIQEKVLIPKYSFGLKGSVKNNVWYTDENTVVYPSGHNLILHHTETKEQQFLSGIENNQSEGFTALALPPSRKILAVAEKSDKAVIVIYDLYSLKQKKVLQSSDIASKEYINLSFSSDSKLCLAQGGAPEWGLLLWSWEKVKVISSVKSTNQHGGEVKQADFSPHDASLVCVSGMGIIKFYKILDGQFRLQPLILKRETPNFLCHAWLSNDRVIAATDNGELWIFENYEFKQILAASLGDGTSIHCLSVFSKGFVAGSNQGVLRIYERSDDLREYYKCTKTFKIEGHPFSINNLAISPSEDNLTCTLENNQMFVFNLSNIDILKEDVMNFEFLSTSFHSPGVNSNSMITGLDICSRKPLVVTCGMDRSIRVWNYIDKTMDLMKIFREDACSIAFHPSGLHILVGFNDKLRFLNLLMDDIRSVKEFPIKHCWEVRFSNGGQYFAAVNSNTVQIYNTYSSEMIAICRGHTNKINSLIWKNDDRKLVTCSCDGSIFLWDLRTGQKNGDGHINPRCQYMDIVMTNDSSSIYTITNDKILKEIDINTGATRFEHESNISLSVICLSLSERILFIGTNASNAPGIIRAYSLPLNKVNPEYTEYQCHDKAVTRLRLSPDNQYLFSTGEDGSLCIFENREMNKGALKGREREANLNFAEEILVTKSDLEEKTNLMHELKSKVDELTLHNEYQLRLKDMNYKEKIKEVSGKFTAELSQERQRYLELKDDKTEMVNEYEEKLKELNTKKKKEKENLESTYKSKIKTEEERYASLQQEKDELNNRWEEENQLVIESHTQFLAEMTSEYDQKVEMEQTSQGKIAGEKENLIQEFESSKQEIEEDADIEIDDVKAKYDAKLVAEREATLRLKGENGIMKKKFTALQKDIEDQKEEIRSLHEKEKELNENIKGLEKDILGHKKEIREREETIQDKEKRIYDLKKKNQELEKFKFVLDYKIKELKKQIEPRENEIADMHQQIEEMDQELEQYHKSNSALDLMIGELRLKMDGMQKEINHQKNELDQGNAFIRRFRKDLREMGTHVDDAKHLKSGLITLYQKFVQNQFNVNAQVEFDAQHENNRQREYLENSVEALKRKLTKDLEMHRSDKNRLMRENVVLTKEINELRRELHFLDSEEKDILINKQDIASTHSIQRKVQENWKIVNQQNNQIEEMEQELQYLQNLLGGPLPSDLLNETSRSHRHEDETKLPSLYPYPNQHPHLHT